MRGVNIGDVRALQIPLPPRVEQNEIVRRIESLLALESSITSHVSAPISRSHRLHAAVLQMAFSGALVPTEAELAAKEGRNYENAHELLERIRRAQNAQPGEPRRGRTQEERCKARRISSS